MKGVCTSSPQVGTDQSWEAQGGPRSPHSQIYVYNAFHPPVSLLPFLAPAPVELRWLLFPYLNLFWSLATG